MSQLTEEENMKQLPNLLPKVNFNDLEGNSWDSEDNDEFENNNSKEDNHNSVNKASSESDQKKNTSKEHSITEESAKEQQKETITTKPTKKGDEMSTGETEELKLQFSSIIESIKKNK